MERDNPVKPTTQAEGSGQQYNDQFLKYLSSRDPRLQRPVQGPIMEPQKQTAVPQTPTTEVPVPIIKRNPAEKPTAQVIVPIEHLDYRLTSYSDSGSEYDEEDFSIVEVENNEPFEMIDEADCKNLAEEEDTMNTENYKKEKFEVSYGENLPPEQDKYEWIEAKLKQIEGVDENDEDPFQDVKDPVEQILEEEIVENEEPSQDISYPVEQILGKEVVNNEEPHQDISDPVKHIEEEEKVVENEEPFQIIRDPIEGIVQVEVVMEEGGDKYVLFKNTNEQAEDYISKTKHQAKNSVNNTSDLGKQDIEASQYEEIVDNSVTIDLTTPEQSTSDASDFISALKNAEYSDEISIRQSPRNALRIIKRYITEEGKYLYVEEDNEMDEKIMKNKSDCELHEDQNMTDIPNIAEADNTIDEEELNDKQTFTEDQITEYESISISSMEWQEQKQENDIAEQSVIDNNMIENQSLIDISNVIKQQNATDCRLSIEQNDIDHEEETLVEKNVSNFAPVYVDVHESSRATPIVTSVFKTSPMPALTADIASVASIPQLDQSASFTGQLPSNGPDNHSGEINNNNNYYEIVSPPPDSRSRNQPMVSPKINGEDLVRNWPAVNVLYQIKELAHRQNNRSTDIEPLDLSMRTQMFDINKKLSVNLIDQTSKNKKQTPEKVNKLINTNVTQAKNVFKPKILRKFKNQDCKANGQKKIQQLKKINQRLHHVKKVSKPGTSSIQNSEITEVLKDIFKTVQQTKIDKAKICDVVTQTIKMLTLEKAVQAVTQLYSQGTQTEQLPQLCSRKHLTDTNAAENSKERETVSREMEPGAFIIYLIRLANWLLHLDFSMYDMIRFFFNIGVMKLGLICANRPDLSDIAHLIVIDPLNEDIEKKILEALKPISEIFTPKRYSSREEKTNPKNSTETNQRNVEHDTEIDMHRAAIFRDFMASLASKKNLTNFEKENCSKQLSLNHVDGTTSVDNSIKNNDKTHEIPTTSDGANQNRQHVTANQIQETHPEDLTMTHQAIMAAKTKQQVPLSISTPNVSTALSDALPMTSQKVWFQNVLPSKKSEVASEILKVPPPSRVSNNATGELTIQKKYRTNTEAPQSQLQTLLCTDTEPSKSSHLPIPFETRPGRPTASKRWMPQLNPMQNSTTSVSRSNFERTAGNSVGFVPAAVKPLMPSALTQPPPNRFPISEHRNQWIHESPQQQMDTRCYGAHGQPINNEMMMAPTMQLPDIQQYVEMLANQARVRASSTTSPLAGLQTMAGVPSSPVGPLPGSNTMTRANRPAPMAQISPTSTTFAPNYGQQQNYNPRHAYPYMYNRGDHGYNPYRPQYDGEKKKRSYNKRTMN